MDKLLSTKIARRHVISLGLLLAGASLTACAPQQPPAPGSWQEQYYRRKEKQREMGMGHDNASMR